MENIMENGAFALLEQMLHFPYNIFKYMIFQKHQKVLLWSKGLKQVFKCCCFFRITKSRMERLRSCYAGGNIGMFDVSYWSYCKVALKQSLTAMQDPSVEELALKVFNSILIYSGVIDAGKPWFI